MDKNTAQDTLADIMRQILEEAFERIDQDRSPSDFIDPDLAVDVIASAPGELTLDSVLANPASRQQLEALVNMAREILSASAENVA